MSSAYQVVAIACLVSLASTKMALGTICFIEVEQHCNQFDGAACDGECTAHLARCGGHDVQSISATYPDIETGDEGFNFQGFYPQYCGTLKICECHFMGVDENEDEIYSCDAMEDEEDLMTIAFYVSTTTCSSP